MAIMVQSEVRARKGKLELTRIWIDDNGRKHRLVVRGASIEECHELMDGEEAARNLTDTVVPKR